MSPKNVAPEPHTDKTSTMVYLDSIINRGNLIWRRDR